MNLTFPLKNANKASEVIPHEILDLDNNVSKASRPDCLREHLLPCNCNNQMKESVFSYLSKSMGKKREKGARLTEVSNLRVSVHIIRLIPDK